MKWSDVGLPYFGGVSSRRTSLSEALVATVFDLQVAQYGIDRGLGRWCQELRRRRRLHAGLAGAHHRHAARADHHRGAPVRRERDKTHGKSMVIIGAAMNHWYHSDMNYRGVINMLMMCGCIGQSGGGWAHYVGQEKLRPQTGWTALAFALDWIRPPRQMNSTSFFYAHTDQWRYEKLGMDEVVSPLADKAVRRQHDRLQRARRAHGLAAVSAPQLRPTRCRWCATRRPPAWTRRTMPSRR
jgi:nitrate reductase alpha subunit